MSLYEQKSYLTDWVATYEISDYMQSISEKLRNGAYFLFRQCAFAHP